MTRRNVPTVAAFVLLAMLRTDLGAVETAPAGAPALENAALCYWPAFTYLPGEGLRNDFSAMPATSDEMRAVDALHQFIVGVEPAPAAEPSGAEWAMDMLRQGAARPHCDWGLDVRASGLKTRLPHLTQVRALVRLAGYCAYRLQLQGKIPEAVQDLLAALQLCRHMQGARNLLIERMTGVACEATDLEFMASLIPALTPDTRLALVQGIESAPAASGSMWAEGEILSGYADRLSHGTARYEDLLSDYRHDCTEAQIAVMRAATAGELADGVLDVVRRLGELERCWSLPVDQFKAAFDGISREPPANPVLPVLFDARAYLFIHRQCETIRAEDGLLVAMVRAKTLSATDPALAEVHAILDPADPNLISCPAIADPSTPTHKPITLHVGWRWKAKTATNAPASTGR